jgi:hypothetical protein
MPQKFLIGLHDSQFCRRAPQPVSGHQISLTYAAAGLTTQQQPTRRHSNTAAILIRLDDYLQIFHRNFTIDY